MRWSVDPLDSAVMPIDPDRGKPLSKVSVTELVILYQHSVFATLPRDVRRGVEHRLATCDAGLAVGLSLLGPIPISPESPTSEADGGPLPGSMVKIRRNP